MACYVEEPSSAADAFHPLDHATNSDHMAAIEQGCLSEHGMQTNGESLPMQHFARVTPTAADIDTFQTTASESLAGTQSTARSEELVEQPPQTSVNVNTHANETSHIQFGALQDEPHPILEDFDFDRLTFGDTILRPLHGHDPKNVTVSLVSHPSSGKTFAVDNRNDSAIPHDNTQDNELFSLRRQLLQAQAELAQMKSDKKQFNGGTEHIEYISDKASSSMSEDNLDIYRYGSPDPRSMEQIGPHWSNSSYGTAQLIEGSIPDVCEARVTHIPRLSSHEHGAIGRPGLPFRRPVSPGPRVSISATTYNNSSRGPFLEGAVLPDERGHFTWHNPVDHTNSTRAAAPNFTSLGRATTSIVPSGMFGTVAGSSMGFAGHNYSTSSLSPVAAEFTGASAANTSHFSPWNMQHRDYPLTAYTNMHEPVNYRRLLERNVECDWKSVVDKIVCNNDQQASISLQQKLKTSPADLKYEIVQAILDQAYPLMCNRFGNFLIQRCFEHGTPEQVVAIANAIRGRTVTLSMDAFGCHVVQKAFDCAPEEYKTIMVHELLRRIPETVIHRYACHVWQKLFELRWNGPPPQIMRFVNDALHGMWHEVALGETGSLVVQNIFENCLDEDKRPCINEVLASIDVIAHGQFGNWVIQHMCEHGSIPDRTRAIDHVLRFATEYSVDQFASKVVEKCLKIGGADFLDRYLDRVCETRPDRPRMPLIDIAGDQFGNYLLQYILTSSDPARREVVAGHIRKHMVSLRGSKYGSRVAMLCTNPAYANRNPTVQSAHHQMDRMPGSGRSGLTERGPWGLPRLSSYDRGY